MVSFPITWQRDETMSESENTVLGLGRQRPEARAAMPPTNPLDEPLETSAEFRRKMGGISSMTEWRLRQKYPNELKPTKINGRNYYTPSQRRAFIKARQAETEASQA